MSRGHIESSAVWLIKVDASELLREPGCDRKAETARARNVHYEHAAAAPRAAGRESAAPLDSIFNTRHKIWLTDSKKHCPSDPVVGWRQHDYPDDG